MSVSAIPLFTSLPPGGDAAPHQAAARHSRQQSILAGWLEAGFAPVSVNTVLEVHQRPDLRTRLEDLSLPAIVVDRPGTAAGRGGIDRDPRCTMSEFLLAIHRHTPVGAVAIVNSDIGRAGAWTAASLPEIVSRGRSVIGQRLDIDAPFHGSGVPEGVMDLHGVDFVAFPAEIIPSLLGIVPAVLRFGMPWWDHYLPLALLMRGFAPRLVPPGTLWHVVHNQRWNMSTWAGVGMVAARQFAAAIRELPPSVASRTWIRLFEGRFAAAAAIDSGDWLVRLLLGTSLCPGPLLRNRVGVLAGGNIALLLQAAGTEVPGGG